MFKTALENAHTHIQMAIDAATKDIELMNLAGEHYEEGENPYEQLIEILERSISEIRFLQEHDCEWDSNGFCCHCGKNGNA